MTKNDIVFGGKEVVKKKKKSENNYAKNNRTISCIFVHWCVRYGPRAA